MLWIPTIYTRTASLHIGKQCISCSKVCPWLCCHPYQVCAYVVLVSLLVGAGQHSTTVDSCLRSTTTKVLSGGSGECQIGSPATFYSALRQDVSIDSWYLEGISLTHGSPRQHIWLFAATPSETYQVTPTDPSLYPCSNSAVTYSTPLFVGNDYFCETANSQSCCPKGRFFTSNLLWYGQGCGAASTCCSYNTPPWFYKRLLGLLLYERRYWGANLQRHGN